MPSSMIEEGRLIYTRGNLPQATSCASVRPGACTLEVAMREVSAKQSGCERVVVAHWKDAQDE